MPLGDSCYIVPYVLIRNRKEKNDAAVDKPNGFDLSCLCLCPLLTREHMHTHANCGSWELVKCGVSGKLGGGMSFGCCCCTVFHPARLFWSFTTNM
jgi:hypothetical protein